MLDAAVDETDDAILRGVDCIIAGDISAFAGPFSLANLADQDVAVFDFLAAKNLNTQPLAGAVVDITYCTACFSLTHCL